MKSCLFETTPQVVSQEIGKFCEGIVPGGVPVYVPVKPLAGAEENRCHVNVGGHVMAHGGEAVFGWIIWQSQVLLDAEAHCNWRSPHGELIDITPKMDGEAKVLFLPDPNMEWEGRMIPSRRVARIDSAKVVQLIRILDEIGQLHAKYRPGERNTFQDGIRFGSLQSKAALLVLEIERKGGKAIGSALSTRKRREKRKAQRKAKKRNRK